MPTAPRTIYDAHHACPKSEQDKYLRKALGHIANIVGNIEDDCGVQLQTPVHYLSSAWEKLARQDGPKFDLPTADSIRRVLVRQSTFFVLDDRRRALRLKRLEIPLDDKFVAKEPDDNIYIGEASNAALSILVLSLCGRTSKRSKLAIKVIELLKENKGGQFIRKTRHRRNCPARFKLYTSRIAETLGQTPNEITKTLSFIRKNLARILVRGRKRINGETHD